MNIHKLIHSISRISFIKTLFINFHYFPVCTAIKIPILVARNFRLEKVSGQVVIDNKNFGAIKLGFGKVGIFDRKNSKGIWSVTGNVEFKGRANLGHGSKISVGKDAHLIIGNNFTITAESTIVCHKRVEIGNNCLFSWDILIMDTDFHCIYEGNKLLNAPKEILVGNHVWIGCRTLVLKGTIIPDNAIVAANSVLNKEIMGENILLAGIPAKKLKSNVTWDV